MERKLRSYVEPGSVRWAMRRAQWGVFGINEEDMEKPKIAIVNTSSNLAACFAHLDGIAAKMKEEIRAAGGLPFEVRTAAPSDAVTSMGRKGGYILPARDLIVNDVEVAVEGAMLDGMICLVSCDKTVPGLLMAAARLNIPTIVVACGYQPSGQYRGEHIDFEDLWLNAVKQQNGKRVYSVEELSEMSKNAILGPGVCAGWVRPTPCTLFAKPLAWRFPAALRYWPTARRCGTRSGSLPKE